MQLVSFDIWKEDQFFKHVGISVVLLLGCGQKVLNESWLKLCNDDLVVSKVPVVLTCQVFNVPFFVNLKWCLPLHNRRAVKSEIGLFCI